MAKLNYPHGLTVEPDGVLLIADTGTAGSGGHRDRGLRR
jgi:hypothetical protein